MSQHCSLATQSTGAGTEVLILDGQFDMSNAPTFERAMDEALDTGRRDLVVDLRGLSYLDSGMVRALIRGYEETCARERHFAVIRPNPNLWRIFVLTGLSQTLPAFGGLADALASFA
jgi:anti-anti-sigma factor